MQTISVQLCFCLPPSIAAGVIPADPKQPFDVRAVLARLLDGSRFHEFKAQVRSVTTARAAGPA